MPKWNKAIVGERLKAARKNAHLTQTQLAQKASLTQHWICNLEAGRRVPSLPTVMQLSAALGVSVDYLCGKTD